MRPSRPLSLLVAVAVAASTLLAALTLVRATLGLGAPPPGNVAATTATALLLVVAVLTTVLVGLRNGETASTPYW